MRDNDLGGAWRLTGREPWEGGEAVGPVNARVPGDVLFALGEAGIVRRDATPAAQREREWVARRTWVYSTTYEPPEEPYEGRSEKHHLHVRVAGEGCARVDGEVVGRFTGPWKEEIFDVTRAMQAGGRHAVDIEIERPARGEGPVPMAGILDARIRSTAFLRILGARAQGAREGILAHLQVLGTTYGRVNCRYRVLLGDELVASHDVQEKLIADRQTFRHDIPVRGLKPWQEGAVYTVRLTVERGGTRCDTAQFYAAFSDFAFVPVRASPGALPYALRVQGKRAFVRGVNLQPPVSARDVESAARAGANLVRFTGPTPPEEAALIACDRLGLVVWQEVPEDPVQAADFAARLARHPCAGAISVGHGLTGADGGPIGLTHPSIHAVREAVGAVHPGFTIFSSSPSGPVGYVEAAYEGRGLLHDAHGPLRCVPDLYARLDACDALLLSKVGFPALARLPRKGAEPFSPLERELRSLAGGNPDRAWTARLSRHLQAEALRYAIFSARRRAAASCAGAMAYLGNAPYAAASSHALAEHGGQERPAYRALAMAWAPVALSVRLEKASFLRGETIRAELFLHVPPGDGGLYAVSARLCDLRGVALAEEMSQLLAKDVCTPCGALTYLVPADAPDALLLMVEARSGEAEVFNDSYLLPLPHEGEPHLAPFLRLPAARPAIAAREGGLELHNDGPDAALGVAVYAGHHVLSYGALLPWERKALAVADGMLPDGLRVEALSPTPGAQGS